MTDVKCCQCDCQSCGVDSENIAPNFPPQKIFVCSFHDCGFQSPLLADVVRHKGGAKHGCSEGERCGVFLEGERRSRARKRPRAQGDEEELVDVKRPKILPEKSGYRKKAGAHEGLVLRECSVLLSRIKVPLHAKILQRKEKGEWFAGAVVQEQKDEEESDEGWEACADGDDGDWEWEEEGDDFYDEQVVEVDAMDEKFSVKKEIRDDTIMREDSGGAGFGEGKGSGKVKKKHRKKNTKRNLDVCRFVGCDFSCRYRDTRAMGKHQSKVHFTHKVYDKSQELRALEQVEKKEVDGEPKFQCGFCQESFTAPRGCKEHILQSHLGKEKLRCLYCPIEKSFVSDLRKHVILWHPYIPSHESVGLASNQHPFMEKDMAAFAYQCCKCSHRAINQEALELHEKFHPDIYNGRVFLSQQKKTFSGQGPDSKDGLMCKFIGCDFSCSPRDTKSMENHQSNIHFSHKVYDLSHELQVLAHMEKKEVGGEPKFQCGFCHRSFAEPRGCKVHILKSHLGKKLRCLYCPTEESFVGDLKRHVLLWHPYILSHESVGLASDQYSVAEQEGLDTFAHQCSKCSHRAINQQALELHEKFHLSSGPERKDLHLPRKEEETGKGLQQQKAEPQAAIRLCAECGWSSKSDKSVSYEKHMENMHGNYVCEQCGFRTTIRSMMVRHAKSHSKVCNQCNFAYARGEDSDHHECCAVLGPGPPADGALLPKHPFCRGPVRVLPDERGLVCITCGFVSKRRQTITRHVRRMHAHEKCHLCDYRTTDRPNLLKHIKFAHELRCTTCGFVGNSKEQVENHNCKEELASSGGNLRLQGRGFPGVVSCPHCGFVPASASFLPRHIRTVHGTEDQKKLHECDQCGLKMSNPTSLRSHKVTMHGLDDGRGDIITCEVCNYRTIHKQAMRRHSQRHLPRDYACPAEGCSHVAGNGGALARHMKKNHCIAPQRQQPDVEGEKTADNA